MEKRIDENRLLLFTVVALAATVRFLCGISFFNSYDTYWYRAWAVGLQDGIFDVYSRARELSLDYPPLYLFCLAVTGAAYRIVGIDAQPAVQMLLMKFWPIVFDVLMIVAVYVFSEKGGEKWALFGAVLYAVNPSCLYNCAFWGQTDSVMALLLLTAFFLAKKYPIWSCVSFAAAGLTKYQALFFVPVFLLYLFKNHGAKKFMLGILSAAGTVAAVFLPFMIGAKNPLLFFDVYLGGAGTYKYCTFNAYNIYGLFKMNCIADSEKLWGIISFAVLSIVFVVLITAFVFFLIFMGERQNIYAVSYISAFMIFVFCTRMHERYQIIVLPLVLMCYLSTRKSGFLLQFVLLTFTTLVNQAVVLSSVHNGNTFIAHNAEQIMQLFSAINLAILVYAVVTTVLYLFRGEQK